jgi:hypothetical protein
MAVLTVSRLKVIALTVGAILLGRVCSLCANILRSPRHPRGWMPLLAVIALFTTACAEAPESTSDGGSPTASATVSEAPPGLEDRPTLPELVDGEADACLPLCEAGLTQPGVLPAGTYQTVWFFGGYMTIELDGSWTGIEDSTGEFKIAPTEDTDYGVSFTLDLFPVSDGTRVDGVPLTAEGLEDWLRANPYLVVSRAMRGDISGLPATVIDVSLSARAPREHADCPDPCVDFVSFEQWDHANGILGDDVYRFYLADVSYSGSEHIFIVNIEGRDEAHLDSFGSLVEDLMPTVQVPAHAP